MPTILVEMASREGQHEIAEAFKSVKDPVIAAAGRAEFAADTAELNATISRNAATTAVQAKDNANSVATALTEFLETKETLTAPAVDDTLSVSGAAADAKATGDAFKETKSEMSLFGVDDLLWDNTNPASETMSGITKVVDKINKTITLTGTATADTVLNFYNYSLNTPPFPTWLQKEHTYYAHIHSDTNVSFEIREIYDGASTSTLIASVNNGFVPFKFSANATGVNIRLFIPNGTVTNCVVRPFVSECVSWSAVSRDVFKTNKFIGLNTDLDTIYDVGSYFISIDAVTPVHTSNPLGRNFGILCVYKNFETENATAVTQIMYGLEISKSYVRRYSPMQGLWTDWVSLTGMELLYNIAIPANTDFDDITKSGYAFINSGNMGYVNAPPLNGGLLRVYNTGSIVTQYANSHKTSKNYVRRKYNNEWSEWTGVQNKKSLKYLAIGNSGTDDMLSYVPFILQNVAPDLDLTIGTTYISGGTIDQQIDAFDNDTLLSYHLYSPGSSAWTIYNQKTLKECLLAEDWDIISIQQASSYQMVWTNYAHVPDLIDRIVTYVGSNHTDYVGHPVKVGYLAPQVRVASSTLVDGKYQVIETPTTYSDYMDCVQRALDEYPLEFAIMSGTAVQTARKETTLDQYGDAQFSDGTSGHMNADYAHLQEGIGCMVASYASTLFLLDLAGINNRSVLGEGTRPNAQWVLDKNIPGRNPGGADLTVVGISDANCLIAQKVAIAAHKKPFEVSVI